MESGFGKASDVVQSGSIGTFIYALRREGSDPFHTSTWMPLRVVSRHQQDAIVLVAYRLSGSCLHLVERRYRFAFRGASIIASTEHFFVHGFPQRRLFAPFSDGGVVSHILAGAFCAFRQRTE